MDVVNLVNSWKENKEEMIRLEWERLEKRKSEARMRKGGERKVEESIIKDYRDFKKYLDKGFIGFQRVHMHAGSIFIVDMEFLENNVLDWIDWDIEMFSEITEGKRLLDIKGNVCGLPFVLGDGVIYINDWYEGELEEEMMFELAKVMRFKKYMGDVFYDCVLMGGKDNIIVAYSKALDNASNMRLISGSYDKNMKIGNYTYEVNGYHDIEGDVSSRLEKELIDGEYNNVMLYLQGSYKNNKSVFRSELKDTGVDKIDLDDDVYLLDVDYHELLFEGEKYNIKDEMYHRNMDSLPDRKLKGEGLVKVREEDDRIYLGMSLSDEEVVWLEAYYGLHQLF